MISFISTKSVPSKILKYFCHDKIKLRTDSVVFVIVGKKDCATEGSTKVTV